MPDLVTTVSWLDGGARRQVFDNEKGRLGWVESVAVYPTSQGPVYVMVSEDKLSTSEYQTLLTAWRLRPGSGELEPADGFFPAMTTEANETGAAMVWGYFRQRGVDVFPRPVEVRAGERVIDVVKYKSARPVAEIRLELKGDHMVAVTR